MEKPTEGTRKEKIASSCFSQEAWDETYFELYLAAPGKAPYEFNGENNSIIIETTEDKIDSLKSEFDIFLGEAIDETLSSLGKSVRNAIYQHLQNDFGIEKKEIPSQIDRFSDIIHRIFGLGATRLEIKFMETLYSKIKCNDQSKKYEFPPSEWMQKDMNFTQYVYYVRNNYGVKCRTNFDGKAIVVDPKLP